MNRSSSPLSDNGVCIFSLWSLVVADSFYEIRIFRYFHGIVGESPRKRSQSQTIIGPLPPSDYGQSDSDKEPKEYVQFFILRACEYKILRYYAPSSFNMTCSAPISTQPPKTR
jgi:hypothetical protein